MKLLRNKRGFSLAEVLIAIAVISVVTVASLSIVVSSTNSLRDAIHKTEAQYFASDALECFRVTSDADEFEAAITFRGGYTGEPVISDDGSTYEYQYTLVDSDYVALVTIDYSNLTKLVFSLIITDTDESGVTKTVAEIPEFVKGGV